MLPRKVRACSVLLWALFCTAACTHLRESNQALEFDQKDQGIYGLLSLDGKLTDIRYRVSKRADEWRVEELRAQGNWVDITCEKGCRLEVTSTGKVAYFTALEGGTRANSTCMNNHAFAICKLGEAEGPRFYLWVALVTGKPIRLFLRRMDDLEGRAVCLLLERARYSAVRGAQNSMAVSGACSAIVVLPGKARST